jgi:hypothetical protein
LQTPVILIFIDTDLVIVYKADVQNGVPGMACKVERITPGRGVGELRSRQSQGWKLIEDEKCVHCLRRARGGEVLTLSQTDWFPLNWEAVQFGNWGYSGEDPDSRRNHG